MNQGFIVAATLGYAIKHGLDYHIPSFTNHNVVWPPAFTYLENPNWNPDLPVININEKSHTYEELPFDESWRDKNIVLGSLEVTSGYFQSIHYFEHCIPEIRKAFKVAEDNYPGCAIHVRGGDYHQYNQHHPPITSEYLYKAIQRIKSEKNVSRFIIFTDDEKFAFSLIHTMPDQLQSLGWFKFEISKNKTPIEDFILMAGAEHQIISNSTFSLMAAILNPNPDKVVISPSKENWFGQLNKHLLTDTLIPDHFIQIKY